MKKIMFFWLIFLIIIPVKAAQCEIVMDADSGRVLYGKNINEKRLIASTTKIMTALVTLNNVNIKDEVTVGEEVTKAYGSAVYIKPQEKLTVEDLLMGLMLRSGNDAALTLATYVAGSPESFAILMNETALSIGMHDTIFNNPHGLDEENENTSTVYDMALLMREAMKNQDFRRITSMKKYSLTTNFNTYIWYNKNKLLTDYKYATGGKIGYTTSAKHTFVSSATKDNKNLIVATFVDNDRFGNHQRLYEKYFEMYQKYNIIKKDKLDINYKKGYKLFTLEDYDMLLSESERNKVERKVTLYDNVEVGENSTKIGTIQISVDGKVYKKMSIFAEKTTKNKMTLWEKIRSKFVW